MARAMAARHRHHRAPPSHVSPPLSHTTAPLSISLPLTLLSLSPSYPPVITSTTVHPHLASRRVHDSHGRHLYPTSAISLSHSLPSFSPLSFSFFLSLRHLSFFLTPLSLSLTTAPPPHTRGAKAATVCISCCCLWAAVSLSPAPSRLSHLSLPFSKPPPPPFSSFLLPSPPFHPNFPLSLSLSL